jgi:DNA-binding response OmpR family regulator
MGGEEAVRKIRQEYESKDIKIVAITASALDEPEKVYLEMGCDYFISKPFHAEDIYNSLTKLVGVEFEYAKEEQREEKLTSQLQNISIPNTLYEKVMKSIDVSSITELEKNLEELGEINEDCKRLKEYLGVYLKNYDLKNIEYVFKKLKVEN